MFNFGKSQSDKWMADESSAICLICGEAFSTYVRKHHCRKCFRLICNQCSLNKMISKDGSTQERICDDCFNMTDEKNNSTKSQTNTLRFHVVVHEARLQESSNTSLDSQRRFYFNVVLLDRIVYTSENNNLPNLTWANEVIPIKLDLRNPLFIIFELWERGRNLSSDELIGKCRLNLPSITGTSAAFSWFQLVNFKNIGSGEHVFLTSNKLWISTHLDDTRDNIITSFYHSYKANLLKVRIPKPFGVHYSIGQNLPIRNIPFADLIRKNSKLFQRLFSQFNRDKDIRHSLSGIFRDAPSVTNFRDDEHLIPAVTEDILIPLPLSVLPFNELLLEGLEKVNFIPINDNKKSIGVLFLTTHRIIFLSYQRNIDHDSTEPKLVLDIPISNISSTTLKRSEKSTKFEIVTRGEILFKFKVARAKAEDVYVYDVLTRMKLEIQWAAIEDNFSCLFQSSNTSNISEKEQFISDIDQGVTLREYQRMGATVSKHWRISALNIDHELCTSYPSYIAVPDSIDDDLLKVAANQRANKRFPALTWLHPTSGGALFRSSQPMSGITSSSCDEDERLVMALRECCLRNRNNMKVDDNDGDNDSVSSDKLVEAAGDDEGDTKSDLASSQTGSAFGSAVFGSGRSSDRKASFSYHSARLTKKMYTIFTNESMDEEASDGRNENGSDDGKEDIKVCKLRILDARSNMSASANVLKGAGFESVSRLGGNDQCSIKFANIENIHRVRDSYFSLRSSACCLSSSEQSLFYYRLSDSKWLQYISDIISGALYMCQHLERGEPVLLHCSDGWDRTAQLAGLAQLLLDPYFRTIEGFKTLIEKDFVEFGHRFGTRTMNDSAESSPIFLQFLDTVWQVWRQFPREFEFGENMLHLLFSAHNGRYTCDFLMNIASWRKVIEIYDMKGTVCEACFPKSKPPPPLSLSKSAGNASPSRGLGRKSKEKIPTKTALCICNKEAAKSCCLLSIWDIILNDPVQYTNKLFSPSKQVNTKLDISHSLQQSPLPTLNNTSTARRSPGGVIDVQERLRYIEPSYNISSLALWTPVHYYGLPLNNLQQANHSVVSDAYEETLHAQINRNLELQKKIEELEDKLAEQDGSSSPVKVGSHKILESYTEEEEGGQSIAFSPNITLMSVGSAPNSARPTTVTRGKPNYALESLDLSPISEKDEGPDRVGSRKKTPFVTPNVIRGSSSVDSAESGSGSASSSIGTPNPRPSKSLDFRRQMRGEDHPFGK